MTRSEWLRLAARVARLWPGRPWEPETVEEGYDLCSNLSNQAANEALTEIAREGDRFAPPPGLVYQRAAAWLDPQVLALTPDVVRDLMPEERERMKRWPSRLQEATDRLAAAKDLNGSEP